MSRWLFYLGFAGSAAWLGAAIALVLPSFPLEQPLTPNEWGDFFAGMAAPLAFWWLVIGYLQQGIELRQNTSALALQAQQLELQVREMKASVAEQARAVDVATQHLQITQQSAEWQLNYQRLSLQPAFRLLQAFTARGSDNHFYGAFTIKNVGHRVTKAKLFPALGVHGDTLITMNTKTVDVWDTDDSVVIEPILHSGQAQPFEVKIDYVDGRGANASVLLRIKPGLSDDEYTGEMLPAG